MAFRSEFASKLHDYQTVEFRADVPVGEKKELLFEALQHQGHNSKQNNVTLETADVRRKL